MKRKVETPLAVDFIHNGASSGTVGRRLLANGFNPSVLRPYIQYDPVAKLDRVYTDRFNVNTGKFEAVVLHNATATLRKDDWKHLDESILRAARKRLKLVADVRAAGLNYPIPNGMGKTVLESERMSDTNDAEISMDGVNRSANDRPEFELVTMPLPIVHKGFSFSARQIAASRSGGSPLDTSMAELSGTKVAEYIEKLTTGTASTYTFGGGTVYGVTNFPTRLTRTITAPTAGGWTGSTLLADVLAMMQQSINAYHYGPWNLYFATGWTQYLGQDFKANSDKTVQQRIQELPNINKVQTLDFLNNFDIVLVEMVAGVIRMVIGMEIMSIEWDTEGGLLENFKVMGIIVPQVRDDINSRTGIVHGSA